MTHGYLLAIVPDHFRNEKPNQVFTLDVFYLRLGVNCDGPGFDYCHCIV